MLYLSNGNLLLHVKFLGSAAYYLSLTQLDFRLLCDSRIPAAAIHRLSISVLAEPNHKSTIVANLVRDFKYRAFNIILLIGSGSREANCRGLEVFH